MIKNSQPFPRWILKPENLFFTPFILSTFFVSSSEAQTNIYTPKLDPGNPLLIVLDNSRSMGKCKIISEEGACKIDAPLPIKINIVKVALRAKINQLNLGLTPIGLVKFGDLQADKIRHSSECQVLDILEEPRINNEQEILKALDTIEPNDSGETPISFAIDALIRDMQADKLPSSRLLLITDGEPNCKKYSQKNFCEIIASYVNSSTPTDFKLDIIGYKRFQSQNSFKNCESKFPSIVKYIGTTNNLPELEEAIFYVLSSNNTSATAHGSNKILNSINILIALRIAFSFVIGLIILFLLLDNNK